MIGRAEDPWGMARAILDGLSPRRYEAKIRWELLASLGRLLDEAADANQGEPRVLAVLDWLREQAGVPK